MSKILVAYFSRAGENYFGGAIKSVAVGNTEICADLIKQTFPDADLFKIEMAAPYADNYRKCVSQVTADMMLHKRPALTALPESIAAYDAIVLGYPNYCGTIPMAVATFLEAFDFTGKKLLPYCTNEGSGMGRSEKDLRKLCPTAVIAPGLAITGSAAAQSHRNDKHFTKRFQGIFFSDRASMVFLFRSYLDRFFSHHTQTAAGKRICHFALDN